MTDDYLFADQKLEDLKQCPDGWTLIEDEITISDGDEVSLPYENSSGATCTLIQRRVARYEYRFESADGETFTDQFDLGVMALYDAYNSMKAYSLGYND